MLSTFGALYIGKSALDVQKKAMEVTGQNISHANDETYARRRVDIEAMGYMESGAAYLEEYQGQVGTGVRVASVQSMRDDLLDNAARREKSDLAYWNEMKSYLRDIESVLNEPGLRSVRERLDAFLQSWEGLAERPDDVVLRSDVREAGRDLALSINNLDGRINGFTTDLDLLVDRQVTDANRLLFEIANLNDEIFRKEAGDTQFPALDLRDARAKKVEVLAELIKIDQCEFKESQLMIESGSRVLLRGNDVFELRTERNEEMDGLREVLWGGEFVDHDARERVGHSTVPTVALAILGPNYEKSTMNVTVNQMAVSHSVRGNNLLNPVTSTTQALSNFGISSGSFTVNGKRIYFDADETNINDMAVLIEKSVPEIDVNVVPQGAAFNLTFDSLLTGTANEMTFGHESDTSNVLGIEAVTNAGLGVIDLALGYDATGTASIAAASQVTAALNAVYTVNDVQYTSSGNLIEDFQPDITLSLKSAGTTKIDATPMIIGGEIKATLEMRDDILVDLRQKNDELAYTIIKEINEKHVAGFGLDGEWHNLFFENFRGGRSWNLSQGAAAAIQLDPALSNLEAVAASAGDIFPPSKVPVAIAEGNDEVADQMIQLFKTQFMSNGQETFSQNFGTMVEEIGFTAARANRRQEDQEALVHTVDVHRQEVMGVNLDEEMSNLIMFQQSFQAAAKFINTFEQILDTIVNRLKT